MERDITDGLINVMVSTTQSLGKMLSDAYARIDVLHSTIDSLDFENTELRKQIKHLQASLDAEIGCEGSE